MLAVHAVKIWMIPLTTARLVVCCECIVCCVLKEMVCNTMTPAEQAKHGMCQDIRKEYGGSSGGAKRKDHAVPTTKVMCYYLYS